jgi:hypothetical protein
MHQNRLAGNPGLADLPHRVTMRHSLLVTVVLRRRRHAVRMPQ